MNVCKECGQNFDTLKSFHSHIKVHEACIGDYYVKYLAKKDLFSGDLLPFNGYAKYIETDFLSYENYKIWLRTASRESAKAYILSKAKERFEEKQIKESPPNLFYTSSKMADISDIKALFGSYYEFLQEAGLSNFFSKNLPKDFWEFEPDIPILVDTREQNPIIFNNSINQKLDFGDYTTNEKYYSKTFIDRKSQDDFRGTFGMGVDRFRREMERCKAFGSYMFVVVESSPSQIEEDNKRSKFKSNLEFAWHNVRSLMTEYPENLQFVFAYNRGGIKKIIPKILYYGKDLWNVDLDYFVQKKIQENA
jgi:hypothetical protein